MSRITVPVEDGIPLERVPVLTLGQPRVDLPTFSLERMPLEALSVFSLTLRVLSTARLTVITTANGSATSPPVNTVAPVASGTVRIGQTLTCTTGTWTGTPTPTYAYQWRRDGVDIGGATASTYVVVAADMACEIDCVVTASNGVSPDADEVSNVLASPWQAILAAKPGVLIWDGQDPYCYGGASVSAPVASIYTVDGVALATQATTAKRATRTATDLDFDGADDGYVGTPTLAPYWQADQTYVVGADGLSGAAGEVALHANGGPSSPYRQALIAGSTNAARNVHRTNDAGASMLGLPTASQDLAVTWTTGAPGAGELFDLASGVTSVRSVAPASLPSHTYTQWTLGGDIALSSTWQGNLRHLAIDDSVWSAGDLALYRSCAIAAGVM